MDANENRRAEERLRYHWPIWYTDSHKTEVSQGQMVDVSSRAAAFTCYMRDFCPVPDQEITARFSVPQYEEDDSFAMADFARTGRVSRIDPMNDLVKRIVLQFHEPLHFRPGERAHASETVDTQMASVPL